ncbi:hypothetical protein D3871_16685 [Noviherbaspirillum saxi]|uniref:Glycine-rich domain-containing protein-like n=2 Tax=Noviherbaspirillum saxi TaxID=2320863 RepID=A0A3A3G7T9_9BURK|nr:hypothetical protein D3871_16685 [Noviherbaspirillum saxi]
MVEAIFALDLDPIKFKLMDAKEGHGWTREAADRHELEYRRFLALIAKYPNEAITPNADVDKFWHGHILDTMKYAVDCATVFGYFLHHFPYFGMRGDEDAANLAEAAARTRSLYEMEFGQVSDGRQSYCARAVAEDASYCARVVSQEASYCARAVAPDASYCARVAQPGTTGMPAESSYCARVVASVEDASYCARVATAYYESAMPAYYATVLGKGRPSLEA